MYTIRFTLYHITVAEIAMSLVFDVQNSSVHIDGAVHKLNEDREFTVNGLCYVVFFATLSTRTHHKVTDYEDVGHKIPALILKDDAVRLVQHFANISAHSLRLTTVPPTTDFEGAINELKNLIIQTSLDPQAQDAGNSPLVDRVALDRIVSILNEIVTSISVSDCLDGIKAGRPICISLNTHNQSLSLIVEQLFEFIHAYTSYDEKTIAYHSLNTCLYILYSIMRILFVERSTFQSDLFVTKNDIIIHYFVSMLMDMITDKCSYELYIKGRHPDASAIVKKYRMRYPVLHRVLTKNDVNKVPKRFYDEASAEPIKLLPYLLTYNMNPKERILYTYNAFVREFNKHANGNCFSCDELWTILENLSAGMVNDHYRSETFFSILPRLVTLLSENDVVK